MIPVYEPYISPAAIQRVCGVLSSGWINEGPVVREFEDGVRQMIGSRYAVAVNSGTSALRMALRCAGIGLGDEVILPVHTFIATAQAVAGEGARTVLCDIDSGTGNICPRAAEQLVSFRTKAIIAVHWNGTPCNLDALGTIASRHGIALIEDAAQAFGASYDNRQLGSCGHMTCFSFQATKPLTTGDGGMITGMNAAEEPILRRMRWFGMERDRKRDSVPQVTEVGFKYNMNDITAAIGVEQLSVFRSRIKRCRDIENEFRTSFRSIDGISLVEEVPHAVASRPAYLLLVDRREEFIQAMRCRGVEAGVWHHRLDRHPLFQSPSSCTFPGADIFEPRQVLIPLRASLTCDEVSRITQAVKSGW